MQKQGLLPKEKPVLSVESQKIADNLIFVLTRYMRTKDEINTLYTKVSDLLSDMEEIYSANVRYLKDMKKYYKKNPPDFIDTQKMVIDLNTQEIDFHDRFTEFHDKLLREIQRLYGKQEDLQYEKMKQMCALYTQMRNDFLLLRDEWTEISYIYNKRPFKRKPSKYIPLP